MLNILSVFDERLQTLKITSLATKKRGYDFLRVNKSLADIRPFLDNGVIYSNWYLGSNILENKESSRDVMIRADNCCEKIDEFHNALNSLNVLQANKIDFSCQEQVQKLVDDVMLSKSLGDKDAELKLYFLKGILDASIAVIKSRQRTTEFVMTDMIHDIEIAEKINTCFEKEGLSLNENQLDSLDEAIIEGCVDLFWGKAPISPKSVHGTLHQSIKQSFNIDDEILYQSLLENNKLIYDILKKTRTSMKKHEKTVLYLEGLSKNISNIDHETAQTTIYANLLPNGCVRINDSFDALALKEYQDNENLRDVIKDMKYWDEFEKKSNDFDKDKIYLLVGKMGMQRLDCLLTDLHGYEEKLDELGEALGDSNNYDEDEEGSDDSNYGQESVVDGNLELEILDYARDLIVAVEDVKKYLGDDFNITGVTDATIDSLMQKEALEIQDINLLEELFYSIEQNVDERCFFDKLLSLDYDEVINLVESMPHGEERQHALETLKSTFEFLGYEHDEDLKAILFDLDNSLNMGGSDINDMFKEFFEISSNQYPDIRQVESNEIVEQIKLGVLSSYVVPIYLGEKLGTQEQVLMFIEGYDSYLPETQKYLQGISKFYGDKMIEFHQENYETHGVSQQAEEYLSEFERTVGAINYLENAIDELDNSLEEERKLNKAHDIYLEKKAMFELPKNFDLQLNVMFYRGLRKER